MRLPPWIWRIVRRRRVRIGAIWAACLIPIGGVGFYPLMGALASRAEQKQIERFKAQGIETDWKAWLSPAIDPEQDVFAHPAAVAERNAPLLAGFRDLGIKGFYTGRSKRPGGTGTNVDLAIPARLAEWLSPPATSDQEAARQLLEGLPAGTSEHWAGLREAWARPLLSWPVSPFSSFGTADEEKLKVKKQIDFGFDHALCELFSGNGAEALEDVRTLLRIQRHLLVSSPNVRSALASTSMAQRSVWKIIWEGTFRSTWNDAQLSSLDQALVESTIGVRPAKALRGELSSTEEAVRKDRAGTLKNIYFEEPDWKSFITSSWRRPLPKLVYLWRFARPPGFDRLDEVRYRDRVAEEVLSPLSSMDQIPLEFYRRYRDQKEQDPGIEMDSGSGIFTHSEVPEAYLFDPFAANMLLMDARRNLLRTGIALERFKLARGAYPAELKELVPDYLPSVLEDPFGGGPLRYQKMPDGSPRVWSIGLNLVDDGGVAKEAPNRGDSIWITRPIPGYTYEDYKD